MSTAHIKLRGGTAADWTSENPILLAREPGIETDTGKIKFGDGTTAWNSLGYAGGGGPTVTGADTQVAVIDSGGNLVGSASLTFAGSNLYVGTPSNAGRLSVGSSGAGTAILNIEGTAANQWFLLVEQGTGGPFFGVGDLDGAFGGGGWTLDDNAGQLVFGDIGYVHGGGVFAFDVPNQKTYQNVDHYFTSDSIGPILIDRTTATNYRLFVDNGVLDIETV